MTTLATKVRKAFEVKSRNDQRTWSEDGRGGLYGYMLYGYMLPHNAPEVNSKMVELGFLPVGENVWTFKGERVSFIASDDRVLVYCSYLLADVKWCEENGAK